MRSLLLFVSVLAIAPVAPGSASDIDIITKNGHNEIENAFRASRPAWPIRGLRQLPTVWAHQATKYFPDQPAMAETLKAMQYGSPEFAAELQKRYGLYYDPRITNDGLPLALTKTDAGFDLSIQQDQALAEPGFTINCRSCHSGTLFTKTSAETFYTEGISNVFFDFERFNADVLTAADVSIGNLFQRNPDRNSMVNAADYYGRLLTYVRRPYPEFDLLLGFQIFYGRFRLPRHRHLEHDVQSYLKTQYWVNVGTKLRGEDSQGLYVDGGFYGNPSSIMYGMAFSLDSSGQDFVAADASFAKHGIPYLTTIKPPAYPYIDQLDSKQTDRGASIYQTNCSGCHGQYRRDDDNRYTLTNYPGVIIPLEKIGTDALRAMDTGFGGANTGNSWLQPPQLVATRGYKAPPLHGIWARAPYLHNASVPTIRQLLRPEQRTTRFAIQPFPNNPDNYDNINIGWKTIALKNADEAKALRRQDPYVRIYDPDQYPHGLTNTGHIFGSHLNDQETDDLIAFLKLL